MSDARHASDPTPPRAPQHADGAEPKADDRAPPRRREPGRWIAAILGLAAIAGIAWFVRTRMMAPATAGAGAGPRSSSPEARVVPVATATVAQRDVPIYLEGLGNAVPLQTVTVKSQVDGRLDRVLFKEGQAVKKGEQIAQVDPRPFAIQLHTAEAAIARDSATLRNAKLNLERYKTLRQQNLVPQQQVDDQQTAVDTASAAIMADAAQAETARLQLDYARITSPIDGVTGVRQVDPGNLVHASDQVGIVVITQLDPIGVVFTLPQDDLPRVSKELAAGALAVDAFSRDGVTKLGSGTLALVDNQINAATATIRLKAILPNPGKALWPNEFVKARLLLLTRKDAIVVPTTVVQRGPQGAFAYVLTADDTVDMRPIEVEASQGELTIVARGLAAGERVVTDGQSQLRPGAKVSTRAPGPPASGAPAGSAGGRPRGAP